MKTNIFIKKAGVLIFIATFLTASLTPTLGFPEYNLENNVSEKSSEYNIENLVSINSFDSLPITALG
jgi:hypothetical protein